MAPIWSPNNEIMLYDENKQNFNSYLTLSTMLELLMALPIMLDIGRLPEFKVADWKPEVH
jgi:hypothetical protein